MQTSESEAAKEWRNARGLTVKQLADLTGYSGEAIYCFERGRMANGNPVPPWVLQRYRMACAGVDAQIRSGFDFQWGK